MDKVARTQPMLATDIAEILRSKSTFGSFDAQFIETFINNCEIKEFGPHDSIWRLGDARDLDFMVVLDGGVAVWRENYGEETVDAFISKGQVIGESKVVIVENPFNCSEFVTLANTRLLKISSKAIDELKEYKNGILLYEGLCRSFLEKLRAQGNMLKVRTGRNASRLAKLFDNFTRDPGWLDLTSIEDQYQKDRFRINLYFTSDMIQGLLDSQAKVIGPVIQRFIKEEIIRMYKVNKKWVISDKPVSIEDFTTNNFPESPYFLFEIIDHTLLLKYTE